MRTDVTFEDDDGVEQTASLPAIYKKCSRCPDGTVDCFEGGVTDEMREDPDFDEDYHNGVYSKPCPDCKGSQKILIPDEASMTQSERAIFSQYQEHQRMWAKIRAEERYERRMGC